MEELKNRYTEYSFSGNRANIVTALSADAVVDRGLIGYNGENVVRINFPTAGTFSAPVDPQNLPPVVYVYGTENYDGLRPIHSVSSRYINTPAPYVAETLDGTETFRVGFKCPSPCEFGGFTVTLASATSTSENLEVINYSARGAAFNNLLYSKDMDTIQYINYMFNPPRFLSTDDRIDVTWANTEAINWGINLYIRELS